MDHASFIELPFKREQGVASSDSNDDKFPESLPRHFIKHYTKEKAKIFDPFLGHGTSAFVAEALGRIPYGIEADRGRYEWSAGQSPHWQNIHHGDAADMAKMGLPKMDFCVTSPPYMMADDNWNPLYDGDARHDGYEKYLKKMKKIFACLPLVMKKNAFVIVQCDNICGKTYTPLVRDFSSVISASLNPVGETIVKWKNGPEGYPLTHCLIFKNNK